MMDMKAELDEIRRDITKWGIAALLFPWREYVFPFSAVFEATTDIHFATSQIVVDVWSYEENER